jgi:murein DD-endopeptidase MepM/ murein hydrolase activator NlpD
MYKFFLKGEGKERRDELGNFNKAYRTQPHRGSDWGFKGGSAGKPVYAVADGVVSKVFWSDVLGNCVIVRNTHDKVYVLVAHLQEASSLKKGDAVIGGETVLGKIGNTGSASAGAHLHAAASTDPMPHLAPFGKLLDLFKLMDADKAKRDALKPKVATVAKKAPAKKPATKKAAK